MNMTPPSGRRSNAVAVEVLREFLALPGCKLVPSRGGRGCLLLEKADGSRVACLVRAGSTQRREKWSLTTHTYVARSSLERLRDWARVQPRPTEAVILYVLRANRRPAPGRFNFAGPDYHLLLVSAADFAARMRPRGSAWGDKMEVAADDFERMAVPLEDWISGSNLGNLPLAARADPPAPSVGGRGSAAFPGPAENPDRWQVD